MSNSQYERYTEVAGIVDLQEVEGGGLRTKYPIRVDECRCGCVKGEARDLEAADLVR